MITYSEELELLLEVIENLKKAEKPILVEGIKDKHALMKFGINNIHSLKKSLEQTVDELANETKEVILLTDLDDEGKKLFTKLLKAFNRHGVKVDSNAYKELFKTRLRQIEGFWTRINKLKIKKRGD